MRGRWAGATGLDQQGPAHLTASLRGLLAEDAASLLATDPYRLTRNTGARGLDEVALHRPVRLKLYT